MQEEPEIIEAHAVDAKKADARRPADLVTIS
jgi:hypothetical protein